MPLADTVTASIHELSGPALDWAVARAVGHDPIIERPGYGVTRIIVMLDPLCPLVWRPSRSWELCGSLIDEHRINIVGCQENALWCAGIGDPLATGNSALEAACRALVVARLGESVEIPAVLAGGES